MNNIIIIIQFMIPLLMLSAATVAQKPQYIISSLSLKEYKEKWESGKEQLLRVLAVSRFVEFIFHKPSWKNTAIVITEDDAS